LIFEQAVARVRLSRRSKQRLARRLITLAAQIAIVGAVLFLWNYASGRWVAHAWVSTPREVADQLRSWFTTGYIWPHLRETVKELLIGLAIGGAAAIVLGTVIGTSDWLRRLMSPIVAAGYAVPHVAILPLFVFWFGIGLLPRVMLVVISVFFPIYTNVVAGLRTVDRDLMNAMTIMGASPLKRLKLVVLPSLAGFIATGLTIAVPIGLVAALLAEMLEGSQGLGWVVVDSTNRIDFKGAYAVGVIVCVIAAVVRGVTVRAGEAVANQRSVNQER